jgi:uncharacterized repeat protein (TIGR03809 family)
MTTSFDTERYQLALERWRVLAERRFEHMKELYETGRWHRYFSEEKFLGLIRETRAAMEMWQRLAPGEAPLARAFTLPNEPPTYAFRTQPPPSPFAATEPRSVV